MAKHVRHRKSAATGYDEGFLAGIAYAAQFQQDVMVARGFGLGIKSALPKPVNNPYSGEKVRATAWLLPDDPIDPSAWLTEED
jgi:hypothetical protein